MSTPQTLDLTLVSSVSSAEVPVDPWWLRIEQDMPDDRATLAEVAELVDTLYDLDPCVETVEDGEVEEEEKPTEAELLEAAVKAYAAAGEERPDYTSLGACAERLSGDYTALLKIVRSHQNEVYRLVFGIEYGKVTIVSTVVKDLEIDTTVNIENAGHVTLEYPVTGRFYASWQGRVSGEKGLISPAPEIRRTGNTLFWAGQVTGTIRVVYPSVYDLVTIDVPGKPNYAGANIFKSQDATVLAFFHRLAFTATVSPPPKDQTADQATLAELCGWAQGTPPNGDDEPIPEPSPDPPKTGCIYPAPELADPEFYKKVCCHPPPFPLPNCAAIALAKPGGGGLSAKTMQMYIDSHDGPVAFIAVGPGPEGCGREFHRQVVQSRSCCDDVDPMSPHPDNPAEISPSSAVYLAVLDGNLVSAPLWKWRASGGLYFAGGGITAVGGSGMYVYSPAVWCDGGVVIVDDGCSTISMHLANTAPPEDLKILEQDAAVAPEGYLYLTALGGVPPYYWAGNTDLELISAESVNPALFKASPNFCGSTVIRVSDSCIAIADTTVRSTSGVWVEIFDFDICSPPGAPYPAPAEGQFIDSAISGRYRAQISRYVAGFFAGQACIMIDAPCPIKTKITTTFDAWASTVCFGHVSSCGPADYSDSCCILETGTCDGSTYQHLAFTESADRLWEWRCNDE